MVLASQQKILRNLKKGAKRDSRGTKKASGRVQKRQKKAER